MKLLLALFAGIIAFFILLILLNLARNERQTLNTRLQRFDDGKNFNKKQSFSEKFLLFVNFFAQLLQKFKNVEKLNLKMQQAGLPLLGSEFIIISLLTAIGGSLFAFLLTLQWTIFGSVAFLLLGFCWFYLSWRINKRKKAFNNQLGDALNMIGNSMRAGFSFMQAIDLLAKEMKPPIGEEFSRVVTEMRLGTPIDAALNAMALRVNSPEFDLVIAAVLIQRKVGGSLAQILDTISSTINERVRMRREVMAITAQGRMSGWILAALPFALAAMMTVAAPNYLTALWQSPIGKVAIGGAFVSELIGIIVINKIVDIDV